MDILERSYDYGTSPLTPSSYSSALHTYLFGGSHIAHSLSPQIHSTLFRSNSTQWSYDLFASTSMEEFKENIQSPTCIGASVTMPNKVKFIAAMDEITEEAKAIGAVNTVFIRLGENGRRRYIGTNTDCIGIRDALLLKAPDAASRSRGKPALVIGGGGAARSAIFALWKWFAPSQIYIVNRWKDEVDAIVADMGRQIPEAQLRHVETAESASTLTPPVLVVGTIPNAEPGTEEEISAWKTCTTFLQQNQHGVLVDMCYFPAETRLTTLAEANNWTTIKGAEVLVQVSKSQQILWQERECGASDQVEALNAVIFGSSNQ
ncbi:unnamed protein product [Clonostachys rhizophaga]|uniref:Shikimate dehydrogenase substrate binding N-terminal domain-containing protein n=1 Tax=Clonostachys rhizophaga TaxID=160324 RepID=A0A9N9V9A1_9HYPO|nr:unnamed protein product [Clonostachys rhizophaga]